MPPFTVNNDGSCQTFTDARWLEEEDIDTIRRWVAAETPEGDATLGVPEPPETPKLSGPGVRTMATPELYVPKAGLLPGAAADDYRCFLVDPELATDQYMTGFGSSPAMRGWSITCSCSTSIPRAAAVRRRTRMP